MTPKQKIMATILVKDGVDASSLNAENIDSVYESYPNKENLLKLEFDFRRGQVKTGLPIKNRNSNYENKSVAAQMIDGSWVGWTYEYLNLVGWTYQKGREWMEDSYDLEVSEDEGVIDTILIYGIVREFKVKEKS